MSGVNTVNIGGVAYDADTGEPIHKNAVAPLSPAAVKRQVERNESMHSTGIHKRPARSQTLNRTFVKKSAPKRRSQGTMDVKRIRRQTDVSRSPMIQRFAPHQAAAHTVKSVTPKPDAPATTHPVVAKALSSARAAHPVATPKTTPHTPAAELKRTAVQDALDKAKPAAPHKSKSSNMNRRLSVASACAAVLLLAGYFTYLNMPNLSVRVAATQAGIDASYPEYHPVGYRLDGPVAFQDGEVSMRFASNSGPQAFSLNQTRSAWDSSALLENYVDPESKGRYATYSDAGLTIYTYGNNAAWVNGGILYTVDGSASLSGEQVRRMATSL